MSEQEPFDWNDFYILGNSYLTTIDPAKQRTGISRFYYSAFCNSRDMINKNKTYLNKKSEEIMTSKRKGNVHQETRKIFKNHPLIPDVPVHGLIIDIVTGELKVLVDGY